MRSDENNSSIIRPAAAKRFPSAGWLTGCTACLSPGTNDKLVNLVFILTDRKSLDTNIREDIEKFTHLNNIVGLARKADDLPRFLKERKPIIVTTQQKFAWVLEETEVGTTVFWKRDVYETS